MEAKRLQRSDDAVIAGVCAGLAEYFNIDAVIVRILAVVLGFASFGVTVLVYIVLWLILPASPRHQHPIEVPADAAYQCYPPQPVPPADSRIDAAVSNLCNTSSSTTLCRAGVWLGVVLVILGLAGAIAAVVRGVAWWQFWPVVLVLGGITQMLLSAKSELRARRIASGIIVTSVGLFLLACSLGILSWASFGAVYSRFWSLLLVMVGLLILGGALHKGVYTIAAAVIFALFCFLGMTECAVMGGLESVIVQLPFLDAWTIDIQALCQ